jgi:hypothetical protein
MALLPTSKRRVPLAPSSVAHCSVQAVVGVYVTFVPASQQPSMGQAAHFLPSKYVGGGHATQPLAPSTRWPGGQSARQSPTDVAPGGEIMPAGQTVCVHAAALPGA